MAAARPNGSVMNCDKSPTSKKTPQYGNNLKPNFRQSDCVGRAIAPVNGPLITAHAVAAIFLFSRQSLGDCSIIAKNVNALNTTAKPIVVKR